MRTPSFGEFLDQFGVDVGVEDPCIHHTQKHHVDELNPCMFDNTMPEIVAKTVTIGPINVVKRRPIVLNDLWQPLRSADARNTKPELRAVHPLRASYEDGL